MRTADAEIVVEEGSYIDSIEEIEGDDGIRRHFCNGERAMSLEGVACICRVVAFEDIAVIR